MLTNPFGRKNNKVQKILKIGDQLALSLRENVELIDSDGLKVTFVTESGYIIEGDFDSTLEELSDIKVTTTDIFKDQKLFDKSIEKQISSVLTSLLEDNRRSASNKFDTILKLWESRSRFDRVTERLDEKRERYNLYASIIESNQFDNVKSVKPLLLEMLQAVKQNEDISSYKGLLNSIKLANTISKAFNLPKVSAEDLHESSFSLEDRRFNSIYDIVCRQELIKKDLMENKKGFTTLWLQSTEINELTDALISNNDNQIVNTLAQIIHTNPYFALATKKQLTELFENSLVFSENKAISSKDLKDFINKIYEAKRDVKTLVIKNLNEKFGVNVQNLKVTPSFSELAKIQKNIFESLAKFAPRNSALKTVLEDFMAVLGGHSGVDVIDLNEWLVELFVDAEFSDMINETALLNYMNFDKVAGDLTKIGQVLKMIQAGMGGEAMPEDGQYEADGSAEQDMQGQLANQSGGGEMPQEEMPQEEMPQEEMPQDDMTDDEAADGELPEESPEEAAEGAEADMAGAEEMPEEEPESSMEDEEFMSYLQDLEGLIDSLKSNMGVEGSEGGEEEGMEEEMPEEGGEEMPEEEVEEEPEEEDEEEEMPPKKKSKKPFPPKE